MNKKVFKCCFCNKHFEGFGNSCWPLEMDEDKRCCDECNMGKVVPARILMLYGGKRNK